ncbi:MAG: ATP-dependent metallopeptidase FtsH/Yme1/Tma family protein, partial [Deltaproteobacteria bacterium]|nr:ATP-dependent metallopeptidase FtsH/Yme1/Tma family protein [Deltaproteobacteria bacterium]
MNQLYKNIAMWLIIIATGVLMYNLINYKQPSAERVTFSDFMAETEKGNVAEVVIQGNELAGKYKDGKQFRTYSPQYPDLVGKLRSSGVKITAEPVVDTPSWGTIFVSWFPMVLLIGVWIFFMRQMQG